MARKKKEYICIAEYTEGCERRFTEALVDIYYKRKKEEEMKRKEGTA